MLNFEALPVEIIIHIVSFLERKQWQSVLLLNKNFLNLLKQELVNSAFKKLIHPALANLQLSTEEKQQWLKHKEESQNIVKNLLETYKTKKEQNSFSTMNVFFKTNILEFNIDKLWSNLIIADDDALFSECLNLKLHTYFKSKKNEMLNNYNYSLLYNKTLYENYSYFYLLFWLRSLPKLIDEVPDSNLLAQNSIHMEFIKIFQNIPDDISNSNWLLSFNDSFELNTIYDDLAEKIKVKFNRYVKKNEFEKHIIFKNRLKKFNFSNELELYEFGRFIKNNLALAKNQLFILEFILKNLSNLSSIFKKFIKPLFNENYFQSNEQARIYLFKIFFESLNNDLDFAETLHNSFPFIFSISDPALEQAFLDKISGLKEDLSNKKEIFTKYDVKIQAPSKNLQFLNSGNKQLQLKLEKSASDRSTFKPI